MRIEQLVRFLGCLQLGEPNYYTHYRDESGTVRCRKTHEVYRPPSVISAPVPRPKPGVDKTDKVKPPSRTTESEVKDIVEVQKEKLSPHASRVTQMFTFSFPSTDGVYVIPPLRKNLRREIRKTYVPSPNDQVYFYKNHCYGCRFSLLQFLAAFGLQGEFDLTPLLREVYFFEVASCVFCENNAKRLNGPDAAQVFIDVMSMFDYVQVPGEEENFSVTENQVKDLVKESESWSRFDFRSNVKDRDDFKQKYRYLIEMQADDPIKRSKIEEWCQRQEAFLSSGSAKLSTVKESPRRGTPGYARVNQSINKPRCAQHLFVCNAITDV